MKVQVIVKAQDVKKLTTRLCDDKKVVGFRVSSSCTDAVTPTVTMEVTYK
jgi:hypothetical protein